MTEQETIFFELTPIFQEIFDDDHLIPIPTMSAKDVDTWDSLTQIRLVVAIEKHFAIRFTGAEVAAFNNVGDLVNKIISKKKVAIAI